LRKIILISIVGILSVFLTVLVFTPVDDARSVHRILQDNSGITRTLSVETIQSTFPSDTSTEPLRIFVVVTYQGQKVSLEASDIDLVEFEDSANKITTPANPTEIGADTDIFLIDLSLDSGTWDKGDRYTVGINVIDQSIIPPRNGFTIASYVVDDRFETTMNQVVVKDSSDLHAEPFKITSDRDFVVHVSVPGGEADGAVGDVKVKRERPGEAVFELVFSRKQIDADGEVAPTIYFTIDGQAGDTIKISTNANNPPTATATMITQKGATASIKLEA